MAAKQDGVDRAGVNRVAVNRGKPLGRTLGLVVAACTLFLAACSEGSDDTELAAIPSVPVERCVTVAGAMEPGPVRGSWTHAVTRTDLQSIASAGFDTVRLPVPLADFTGEEAPFEMEEDALERLDTVVDWALGANLNVILAVSGFDALEADVAAQSGRLNRIWLQVAEQYRTERGSILFELLDAPGEALSGEALDELTAVIVKQVRGVDRRRWLIIPTGHGGDIGALDKVQPPADARTILTFRYFDPVEVTAPAADAAAGVEWGSTDEFRTMLADLQVAADVRDRTRRPVMLGGFGVTSAVPDVMRARWVRAVRRTAEDQGMAWCHMAFAGDGGIFDTESNRWSPELVDALFRDDGALN
ncbi:MAG: cellulase family glycosylhydrolase [Pseudomonadota bacterium]